MKSAVGSLSLSVVIVLCTLLPFTSVAAQPSPNLVITQLSTGSSTSAYDEVIELYNNSNAPVNITGWSLEYTTANNTSLRTIIELEGLVEASSFIVIASSTVSLPDKQSADYVYETNNKSIPESGGHIRLLRPNTVDIVLPKIEVDRLGWGAAIAAETSAAPALASNRSDVLHRCTFETSFVDTDNNALDFRSSQLSLRSLEPLCDPETEPEPEEPSEEEDPPAEEPEAPYIPNCDGLLFSEFLPNPAGADSGSEFIELYNPTDEDIDLKDCSFELSGTTQQYIFTESVISAKTYAAFSDTVTDITLPNTAGGTVLLVQGDVEIGSQSYLGALKDNIAWALIDGAWQQTAQPTPNEPNRLPLEDETGGEVIEEVEPCPEGKYRNPETNRCRNIVSTASSLIACSLGQERNPATNRCRAISSAASGLVPCSEDQERNPETNRCRSILSASSVLSECPEGQERNPSTNRCRRVVTDTIERQVDPVKQKEPNFGIAIGGLSAATVGYGAFEYRKDVFNLWRKLRKRS